MWTLHTAIPDLRGVEWSKCVNFQEKNKSLSMKYLLRMYDLEFKSCRTHSKVVYTKGNFYHHKKENGNNIVYYINVALIEEVVGSDKHDINGYVFELLAYGFFDKTVRKSLKENNRNKSLFRPSEKTFLQDSVAIKQYNKVFIHGE